MPSVLEVYPKLEHNIDSLPVLNTVLTDNPFHECNLFEPNFYFLEEVSDEAIKLEPKQSLTVCCKYMFRAASRETHTSLRKASTEVSLLPPAASITLRENPHLTGVEPYFFRFTKQWCRPCIQFTNTTARPLWIPLRGKSLLSMEVAQHTQIVEASESPPLNAELVQEDMLDQFLEHTEPLNEPRRIEETLRRMALLEMVAANPAPTAKEVTLSQPFFTREGYPIPQ